MTKKVWATEPDTGAPPSDGIMRLMLEREAGDTDGGDAEVICRRVPMERPVARSDTVPLAIHESSCCRNRPERKVVASDMASVMSMGNDDIGIGAITFDPDGFSELPRDPGCLQDEDQTILTEILEQQARADGRPCRIPGVIAQCKRVLARGFWGKM